MRASIVFGIACIGSYVTGSSAYNFFGSDQQDSKFRKVEHPQAPPFKLDYKLSFKKPYYYYNNTIPFWTTSGGKQRKMEWLPVGAEKCVFLLTSGSNRCHQS
jgi:hypothetical protein